MRATSSRTRGRLGVGALAATAVLLVAGCGDSGSSTSGTNSGQANTAGGGPATSGIPSTVTLGLDRSVTTLDPDKAIQPPELAVLGLAAGTLTSVGPDGKEVKLALAKSQKVSKDGLTWTYQLKPGVKFSDGSPLTAADAAASYQRSIDDKANVHGSFYAPMRSVTASGNSVVFHLKSPYASLPMVITQPEFAIFPRDKLASKDFFKQPISAGPYVVTSYPSEQRVDLAANPNYSGPAPLIKKLVFEYIEDPGTRLSELKAGQIQWAGALPGTMLPQITGDGVRQVTIPGFSATYVYVNDRKPPLDDVRVRKAMSLAIDRNKLNQIAYAGKTKPLLGFLPSTMDYSEATVPGTNINQAKQMLAGSACAHGCHLTLTVRNGLSDFLDMASVIQQQLKPLGIDVSIERTDPAIASKHELDGDFQLEVNNLLSRANFPDGFLNLGLFSDTAIKALYSGYDSPQMDAAIRSAIANGGAKRAQAMHAINQRFAADLPYIPLVNGVEFAGTSLPDDVLTEGPNGLYYVGSR